MGFFKPFKILVEYQSNDVVKSLEKEIEHLKGEYEKLEKTHEKLEIKFAQEMYVQMELMDVLREHDIPFRHIRASRETFPEK